MLLLLLQHTAFLFKRIVQGLDFQNPDPFKQQGGENHGDNLCKGNRPPYHGQTGQYGEKVCRRKDHQELSRRRYNQAVDTISQSLKNRAYNDTVPGKDKAQAEFDLISDNAAMIDKYTKKIEECDNKIFDICTELINF